MKGCLFTFLPFYLFTFTHAVAQTPAEVTIDLTRTYQTIQDFGASDCWTAEYVSQHTGPDEEHGQGGQDIYRGQGALAAEGDEDHAVEVGQGNHAAAED